MVNRVQGWPYHCRLVCWTSLSVKACTLGRGASLFDKRCNRFVADAGMLRAKCERDSIRFARLPMRRCSDKAGLYISTIISSEIQLSIEVWGALQRTIRCSRRKSALVAHTCSYVYSSNHQSINQYMASIKPTKSTETGSQLEHRGATDYPETPNVFISPHHNPVSSQTNVHYGIEQDYANAGSGHHRVQMGQESSHQQPPLPPSPATHSHRSNGAAQHPLSQPDRTTAPDTQRVTRAFGLRVIRTVRRGQLPFLLVFFG